MFDRIAVIVASFLESLVVTAASLSGHTGSDGEHHRCTRSDEIAHGKNMYMYSRLFPVGMLVCDCSDEGMSMSTSDEARGMDPKECRGL